MPSSTSRDGIRVAIVSANQETLDDLEGYLQGVGLATSSGRQLGNIDKLAPSVLVLVMFPDDFLRQKVVATVTATIDHRPRVLPVLVTNEPRRYEELLDKERILVLPRPIWAWTIHDAIRAHLAADVWRSTRAAARRKPAHRRV